ncbi:hypothetical protein BDP27DRAFT_1310961 [Rhodocollybia butyracea]|uniref:F-box domain-containing protein n=1 Tax=Rhodocollybia butyracea TaxID=206335 RepID=A0A9P5Q4D8_9AGAR|nr:hypothetical protein BDP27DRAFT_1310961 [Rhodocollybia butyracea]
MTWTIEPTTLSRTFRPLAFDRANRGRPIKSRFPLFRLPIEVLHDVAPHIPSSDLETLALIDRDCRQLARSVQFFSVTLTCSDVSLGILEALLIEVQEGARSEYTQALGPCIRHITIDIGCPALVETRLARFPTMAAFYNSLTGPKSAQDAYLRALATILDNSLPNLQSLNWQSRIKIPAELVQSLTLCAARHVVIDHAVLDCYSDAPNFYGSTKWPIESLALDVEWFPSDWRDTDSCATTIAKMLQATSLTLETFSWKGTRLPLLLSFGQETIDFPRLRTLSLNAVPMQDFSILSSFLSSTSRITSLEVSSSDTLTVEFLGHRGQIPSLECFTWLNQSNPLAEEDIITFIQANPQLHSLSICQPLPSTTIDTHILPSIKSDFRHVTSLHLVWDSTSIPEISLGVIGNLHLLRKLWLSAGNQVGWCNNWEIEHEVVLDVLRPLHQLECLAFSRDSYKVEGHPLFDSSIEGYYVNSVFPSDVHFQDYLMSDEQSLLNKVTGLTFHASATFDQARYLQIRLRKAAWERWHQQKMVELAKEYASIFPRLNWCYIGQYPMRVEQDGNLVVETTFREENIKQFLIL